MRSISTIWDSLTNNDFADAVLGAVALTGVLWLITDTVVLLLNQRLRGKAQTYSGISRVLLFEGVHGKFRWSQGNFKSARIERYKQRSKISRSVAIGAAVVLMVLEAAFLFLSAPLSQTVTQDSVVGSELFARVNLKEPYRFVFPEPCTIDDYAETRSGAQSAKLVTCLTLAVVPFEEAPQLDGSFLVNVAGEKTFALVTLRTKELQFQMSIVVYVLQPDGKRFYKSFGSGTFVNGTTLNSQYDVSRNASYPTYVPTEQEQGTGFSMFRLGVLPEEVVQAGRTIVAYTVDQLQSTLRVMIAERDGIQGHYVHAGVDLIRTEEPLSIGEVTRPILPTLATLILDGYSCEVPQHQRPEHCSVAQDG